MLPLWLKAFHIIAVISWMAGLLYFWRLLVYHAMEREPVVIARLQTMERRLRRAIMNPAMVVAAGLGVALLVLQPEYLRQGFMHAKLALVALLLVNHGMAVRAERRLGRDPSAYSHKYLRVMNEVPTLLMIGIVILIVVRPF
jgi:putative membrane protein